MKLPLAHRPSLKVAAAAAVPSDVPATTPPARTGMDLALRGRPTWTPSIIDEFKGEPICNFFTTCGV